MPGPHTEPKNLGRDRAMSEQIMQAKTLRFSPVENEVLTLKRYPPFIPSRRVDLVPTGRFVDSREITTESENVGSPNRLYTFFVIYCLAAEAAKTIG